MRAKIIRQTGNDTALSSSKSFQSGSCYFLRRFRPVSEFFLPCNDMKLGFRRTGAESANPDSVRLHFLGETLGKEQIKGFRRGIGGNVGNRLKRSRRGEDQDIAATPRNHRLQEKMSQMNHRGAVHLNHVEQPLPLYSVEFAIFAKARVVDKQIDFNSFIPRESKYLFRGGWIH